MTRRAALCLASLALLLAVSACRPASKLPELGRAPDFSLTDERGQPFLSSTLTGKVVIADFVFTTCTDVCPLLSANMAQVRDGLKQRTLLPGKVQILSITVDPEQDTPAVLQAYAQRFGGGDDGWRFLTGDRTAVETLLTIGFKVGAPAPTAPGSPIVHTSRFVIVDPRGQIRWYPRGDEVDPGQIVDEVRKLVS
ncbi:MAG: SCO family protein [Chloroflexota bacterium]